MPGKRITDLTALSGANSANNDDLVIFDTTAGETKRISRSQLAEGMIDDLPFLYFHGVLTADPTQRFNGDSLALGDGYLRSSDMIFRYYTASGWQNYEQIAIAAATAQADRAEDEADRAEVARDDAQGVLDDRLRRDVATLLADTTLTYTSAQPGTVVAGDVVRTRAEGFAYEVAASGATDHHVITAGGVKLYVLTPDVRAFGAVGNGATDDTAAFTKAATAFKTVNVPDSALGYEVGSGVVAGTATFKFNGGAGQLSGTATPEQVNGLFDIAGRPGGVMFAPALRTKKLRLVAGAIRQNATDRTKWDYISDANHTPVGVSGAFATAAGPAITITFDTTMSKVISFVAGPDEELAGKQGLTVGASVGLSSAILWASARIQGSAIIYYNGSTWVISEGANQNLFHTPTFSSGNLTIQNNWCPGIGLTIAPYSVAGAVIPYMPVIKAIGNTNFVLNFENAGAFVTAADTRMAFAVSKHYNEALTLDGTTTSLGDSSQLGLNAGNIWFSGIFQEGP